MQLVAKITLWSLACDSPTSRAILRELIAALVSQLQLWHLHWLVYTVHGHSVFTAVVVSHFLSDEASAIVIDAQRLVNFDHNNIARISVASVQARLL
jgi:hypothetical protein